MGTATHQIATEGNIESTYSGYIDSTATNKKCATVKRLMEGLLLSNNYPVYSSTNPNNIANNYKMKSWGSFSATNVTGYLNIIKTPPPGGSLVGYFDAPTVIAYSSASNYKSYPFNNGQAVCCFKNQYTVTVSATFTITSGYKQWTFTPSSYDISPASLDIDNPEEDTETNTDGQEPTIQPFNVNPGVLCSINLCSDDDDIICQPITVTSSCGNYTCNCDGTFNTCGNDGFIPGIINNKHTDKLYYNVYIGDANNWNLIVSDQYAHTQPLLTQFMTVNFTVTIPSICTFSISQTPTTAFSLKFEFSHRSATLAVDYTVKIPAMAVAAYNPYHKCVKYKDLPDLYTAYGKS